MRVNQLTMARKTRKGNRKQQRQSGGTGIEKFGQSEVDAFHSSKDVVGLGNGAASSSSDSDSESDDWVMDDVKAASDDDDEEEEEDSAEEEDLSLIHI